MDVAVHGQLAESEPVEGDRLDLALLAGDHRFLGEAEIQGMPEFHLDEAERPVLAQDQVDLAPAAAEVVADDIITAVRKKLAGQRFAAVADGFAVDHTATARA